jgi:hypothetical protein
MPLPMVILSKPNSAVRAWNLEILCQDPGTGAWEAAIVNTLSPGDT